MVQGLTTVGEDTAAIIQPYLVCHTLIGHNRIQVAVAIHIAQIDILATGTTQVLASVSEGAAAIVQPHPVSIVIGRKRIQIAVAVQIAQLNTSG